MDRQRNDTGKTQAATGRTVCTSPGRDGAGTTTAADLAVGCTRSDRGEWIILSGLRHTGSGSYRYKNVAERYGSGVADAGFVLPSDHRHHADTARFLVTMKLKGAGMNALLARTPEQFARPVSCVREKPRPLAGYMPVMALLNVAGPSEWPENPPPRQWRFAQPKSGPCMTLRRMLKNAPKLMNSIKRSRKAPAIISQRELVRLACASMPETSPTLAWRMGNNRMRPNIETRISLFIPRIDVWKSEVTAAFFYEERRDHAILAEKVAGHDWCVAGAVFGEALCSRLFAPRHRSAGGMEVAPTCGQRDRPAPALPARARGMMMRALTMLAALAENDVCAGIAYIKLSATETRDAIPHRSAAERTSRDDPPDPP